MKKIVFFDADQTVLDMRTGVPESTRRAIERLVDNGHEAILCTGRAYSYVPDELRRMAFTGYIANGGAYISHQGKILLNVEVDPALALKTVEILRQYRMIPVLEGTNYMYFDPEEYTDDIDHLAVMIREQLGSRFRTIRGNEQRLGIAKCSAKIRSGISDIDGAIAALTPWYDYIQHYRGMARWTVEFTVKGHTKGTAVETLCKALQIPISESICFGDSMNDYTMFQACRTKVAMGGSVQDIIDMADFVTDSMFEDGIQHGLERLGLI